MAKDGTQEDVMREIKRIVIHCADTPNGKHFDAKDIDRWHRERGWSGIGYHNVICINGDIQRGRPYEYIGAHVRGHNIDSIGICLIGCDKFTPEQWASLHDLVEYLHFHYRIPKEEVFGHCDLDSHKTCPNFDVKTWMARGAETKHVLQ